MKCQDQLLGAVVIALAVAGPVTVRAVADAACFQSTHDIAALNACNRRGPAPDETSTVSAWRTDDRKEVNGAWAQLIDQCRSPEVASVGAPDPADAGVPSAESAQPYRPHLNANDRRLAPEPDFVPVGRAWISPLGRDA
jgi:hypothetical protein